MAEQIETTRRVAAACQPGEAWEYGHSTDVLGRVVEIVVGRRSAKSLRERIFAPLGMADTAFYTPPVEARPARGAHSYRRSEGRGSRHRGFHRAAGFRNGRDGPSLDDRRLCALSRDARRRRRARRRAHSRAAHDRLYGDRPSRPEVVRRIPLSAARARLRPRLRGAHRRRASRRRPAASASFSGAASRAPRSGSRRATRCSRS